MLSESQLTHQEFENLPVWNAENTFVTQTTLFRVPNRDQVIKVTVSTDGSERTYDIFDVMFVD